MRDNNTILKELRAERSALSWKIHNLNDFKYNTDDYNELDSLMAQMLDTQLEIMNSYFEILTLRIMYIKENKKD